MFLNHWTILIKWNVNNSSLKLKVAQFYERSLHYPRRLKELQEKKI